MTVDAGLSDPRLLASVLTEIADAGSESIELHQVIHRVAACIRRVISFDDLAVVRIIDDGARVVLHAHTSKPPSEDTGLEPPITDWSPQWRPRLEGYRFDDASAQLDPAFPMDARVLDGGLQSGLWEPFGRGGALVGGVFLCSRQKRAFHEEHQRMMRPIVALLGASVEHWQMWDAERRRRARLDRVEALLATLAESLDVREVFRTLSAQMQGILPHHLLNLTAIDLKARTIRIVAHAGEFDAVRTDTFPLTEQELEDRADHAIIGDIPTQLTPDTERNRLIVASGLRSWLHVPVLMSGEVRGSLSFLHRDPNRYGHGDAEVALRVAARVALTLSHQRLAEEARVAAEVRERAERLEARVETLARELESRERSRVVGTSRSWRETLRQVERVAGSETTVLITGESGTGKEVIARLLHQGSGRERGAFVAINCAALPEQLLESELFGHEKGSFTGAIATKIGRLEQAEGGTLFLDEIGEMSPMVQAKLLRVLEEREFQRVGGTRTLRAEVRVVAATHRDLGAAIARQAFREDLYYRLNVFQIGIAPLRERPEDILPLAEAFLEELGRTMGRPSAGISRDAREWLVTYRWPGNVRELRNAIERAILLCDGGLITHDHLPAPLAHAEASSAMDSSRPPAFDAVSSAPDGVNLAAMERATIERALAQSKGNKSKAARLLGLSRAQLYWRLERHGLD